MEWIGEYLHCITAASILCGIVKSLIKSKGVASAMVKTMTGVFLVITLVSPWMNFDGFDLEGLADDLTLDADSIIKDGQDSAQKSIASLVTENTQAYILDKAAYLGMNIDVEVSVSNEAIPTPVAVKITGPVSPYAKNYLLQCITKDLGIAEEALIWI